MSNGRMFAWYSKDSVGEATRKSQTAMKARRVNMTQVRATALKVSVALASLVLVIHGTASTGDVYASPARRSTSVQSSGLTGGSWMSSAPVSHGRSSGSSPYVIVGGGGSNCPNGTYNYSNNAWNCVDAVADLYNHNVWIRNGTSGSSGFGYQHFYVDHNLDLDSVEVVILNNYGILQPSSGRYEYAEYFVDSNGNVDQWVYIYEQRSIGNGSPDSYELGVVTAFCADGNGVEESWCPDWVNSTL